MTAIQLKYLSNFRVHAVPVVSKIRRLGSVRLMLDMLINSAQASIVNGFWPKNMVPKSTKGETGMYGRTVDTFDKIDQAS
jgi:hypothetical protein